MALNIKNPAAEALVKELAERTGESQTTAVTVAVRERLERLRRPSAERMRAIGRDCAHRLPEPFRSADHAALLYDERGLLK
ncbi:MAG: type II toxin-antitoxin system VapB family antitoxin [Terriglobales bacterium]